jgi:MFS family permease
LACTFAALMVGTTLPTPMYALFATRMHFSVVTTTVVFAMYAGGVLAALMAFGRWSDAVGRRPMLLLAIAFAIGSAGVFLVATGTGGLLLGRLLSGLSAGVATGTATAAVIEAAPQEWRDRAAAIATVANIGGLGLGPLIAGLLVQYAPQPLKLPFVVHIALMVLAAVSVAIAPETSPRSGRIGVQRLSVPAQVRTVFVIAATAAFAGFAVLGLFNAVSPSFLAGIIGIGNHAVAGAIVCSLSAASACAQLASGRINPNRAVAAGCAVLVIGMVIIAASLQFSSVTLLILGALVAGAGQGVSFSRGLAAVAEQTPEDRRAEVSSTYFVVAYIAISLPVIGEGLAAEAWGLRTAGIVFALAVSALAAVCLAAILVEEHNEARR